MGSIWTAISPAPKGQHRVNKFYLAGITSGSVAEWLGRWTCEQ